MKKNLEVLLILLLICFALIGCSNAEYASVPPINDQTNNETERIKSTMDDERTVFEFSTMVKHDCDLLSIELPDSFAVRDAGKTFVDEESTVWVTVKLISKYSLPYDDLEAFAQAAYDSVESKEWLQYDEKGFPNFVYNSYTYLDENYVYAADLAVFCETQDVFIKVDFICKNLDFDIYRPYFEEWSKSITVNEAPTGTVYHGRNEVPWECHDICLWLDPSFKEYHMDSYDLYLVNHYGEQILVRTERKTNDIIYNNFLEIYADVLAGESDVNLLPNGWISYISELDAEKEKNSLQFYKVICETDCYWYFIDFAAPKVRFEEHLPKLEEMASLVQIVSEPDVGTNWKKAERAVEDAYKETFGGKPVEIRSVYQDDTLGLFFALKDDQRFFMYATEKNEAWEARQIFHYKTKSLQNSEDYFGDAYMVGDKVILVLFDDVEINIETTDTERFMLPEFNVQCIIMPQNSPDYNTVIASLEIP